MACKMLSTSVNCSMIYLCCLSSILLCIKQSCFACSLIVWVVTLFNLQYVEFLALILNIIFHILFYLDYSYCVHLFACLLPFHISLTFRLSALCACVACVCTYVGGSDTVGLTACIWAWLVACWMEVDVTCL